ncbi:MAG: GNAT family N-acetyltransferase, partial [Helicobacter sp.]|nr:GNAT family N-acetyltransferase [Helicobacter sp.]
MHVQILVLDFGSQYTQLIARRLREYGVYTEIVPYFESIESVRAKNPKGIILSGGPASVYEEGAYKPDSAIFALGIPILGICYGLHLIAHHFGGRVIKADAQEFGKAILEILKPQSRTLGQQKDCASDARTILATQRTILREYTQKDFETLCEILGDSQTMYAWGQGFEAQETQEWLDEQIKSYEQNGFGIWAIFDKKSGEIIGNAGLNYKTIHADKIAQDKPQKVIEIGYLLRHDFWGKGYATECANACMEYAFSVLGLEKVHCFVKEDNLASIKVAQRLGMRKIDECMQVYKGKKLPHLVFESQRVSYDLLGKAMLPHVVKLWEGSVRSSHHFLNEQDILSIQREVKKALKSTQHVIVAKQKKTFLGFIGIEKNRIEMLFVSPLIFRQGIGRALIKETLNRFLNHYQTISVDCNEQNSQALGFYRHLGFEIIGRSPTDSAGRDFPIVHLEVRTDKLSSILFKNPPNYAIMPAHKQDLQAILALQHAAFVDEAKRVAKMDIEPLTQDIESMKREFKRKLFLKCVLENGKIIGSVRGYKENDTAYIGKLFVDSAYRKKGIGSALVEALCAMLPAK